MKWYIAKIVFRIICGNGAHKAQFDEQIRLIVADDGAHALCKAQEMGEQEQENFMNHDNQIVQWKFINISELYELHDMTDGAELFSKIEEQDDAEQYITVVNNRARHTMEKYTEEILIQL